MNKKAFTRALLAAAVAASSLAAQAQTTKAAKDGYLTDSRGEIVRSSDGLCWRTSSWTQEKALKECNDQAVPQPAQIRSDIMVRWSAEDPVVEVEAAILKATVLFDVNSTELTEKGEWALIELAETIRNGARPVQLTLVAGHADRVGSRAANQKLSEKRAAAIAGYLARRGIDKSLIKVAARGEMEPVTGKECRHVAKRDLASCLAPDRRVDITVIRK